MATTHLFLETDTRASQTTRASIVAVNDDATVSVAVPGLDEFRCDVLVAEPAAARFSVGDAVLVWLPADDGERGVVLGRIGGGSTRVVDSPAARATQSGEADLPDTLVIEARRELILRVGEGTITIRPDGKILIKGKDLVSHAQRMNRIRGGAVAIN